MGLAKRGFSCPDCSKDPGPMFIVKDEVWLEAALKNEFLCFDCFEKRLGRMVVFEDLKPCLLTDGFYLALRIAKRSFPDCTLVVELPEKK